MSLITDPDNLTDTEEIVVDTANQKIQLVETGNLSSDGVTIKCVYSKLKELWKTSSTYIKYPFPMIPITDEQFEVVNGWDWNDDTTRYLLRTGGWALKNVSGTTLEEWACIIGLGSLTAGSQVYFQQTTGGSATNFQLTDQVNQAIQIYQGESGEFDYRSYLKLFCREWQKTYASSDLSAIGVTTMSYQAYRFPLANTSDPKVTHTENEIDTTSPYTEMLLTWTGGFTRNIGEVNYNFHVCVGGESGTTASAEQIYEFVQRQLRKDSDIDNGAGSQIGKVTSAILRFVGDTLYTNELPEGGTFIDIYQPSDINRLVFVDDTGTERTFPYVAVLTISFGDNLINDADAKYWIFFTTNPSGDYGTDNAILIQDNDNNDMSGNISSQSSVQHTFNYNNNNQGGRTPDTDAPFTAVAIGLSTGQFVKATGTIEESIANSISLVAPLERNYSNPA